MYNLAYRPGTVIANADLMSRLPLPLSADGYHADVRLTDLFDVGVYHIRATGARPAWRRNRPDSSLEGLRALDLSLVFAVGEKGQNGAAYAR